MRRTTRRRFLQISAAASLAATTGRAEETYQWRGTALGARATITLRHPEGEGIARRAFAEISRLERVFSLYRSDSALSRLNAKGQLAAPPFELLECLALADRVHRATGGLFDPSVQPLWALHAEAHAAGAPPQPAQVAAALRRVGWRRVRYGSASVGLQPGMALTLNGIAQGLIADRVVALLRAEGLRDVLVDTGEFHALGGAWPVSLDAGEAGLLGPVRLRDRALASSAPLGTVFDREGRAGHILDPLSGRPAAPVWRLLSVTAPSAALADALSTAMVLMDEESIARALAAFPDASLVAAVRAGDAPA